MDANQIATTLRASADEIDPDIDYEHDEEKVETPEDPAGLLTLTNAPWHPLQQCLNSLHMADFMNVYVVTFKWVEDGVTHVKPYKGMALTPVGALSNALLKATADGLIAKGATVGAVQQANVAQADTSQTTTSLVSPT